ncbi:hypothetical protein [Brevibacillus laterosporus]|uniref:hypothetical protein n=1 Tax=Brevibacillus laterosporus TaxID=1465 RepID=UPI00265CFDC0|nr:hypothetical protein [Brevibacillus laterosporus]
MSEAGLNKYKPYVQDLFVSAPIKGGRFIKVDKYSLCSYFIALGIVVYIDQLLQNSFDSIYVLLLIELALLYVLFQLANAFIAPFIQKICTRYHIHVLVIYIVYFLFFTFALSYDT